MLGGVVGGFGFCLVGFLLCWWWFFSSCVAFCVCLGFVVFLCFLFCGFGGGWCWGVGGVFLLSLVF